MKTKMLLVLSLLFLFTNNCNQVFADGIIKADPLHNLDQGAKSLRTANDKLYFSNDSNQYFQYDGEKFSYLPPDFNPVTVYNRNVPGEGENRGWGNY